MYKSPILDVILTICIGKQQSSDLSMLSLIKLRLNWIIKLLKRFLYQRNKSVLPFATATPHNVCDCCRLIVAYFSSLHSPTIAQKMKFSINP